MDNQYWLVNPATREVVSGPHSAPVRGGIAHIPVDALRVTPKPAKAGFAVVALADLSGTDYIADHRGQVYWLADGSRHEITKLGVTSPADALDAEPPKPFADLKAEKLAEIERERDARRNDPGLTVEVEGARWQVDPDSIINLRGKLAVYSAAGATPAGFVWRDADNTNHPAPLSLLIAIGDAHSQYDNGVMQQSWDLKKQVTDLVDDTPTNREALAAIAWPADPVPA